ncbi:MAG: flippase-like domain-containing protein [Saprospiraceae bacterium]|nr:flippase-like domain-containing protein [Saprospiraceae bacterium]
MPDSSLRIPFDLHVLLRRLLPIICIGVLLNLLVSWYTAGPGGWHLGAAFSLRYVLLAAVLSLLPWFWHCVRLWIWGRFFGVAISWRNLLRIAVATDVGGSIAPQAVGGAPLKITMLVQQGYSTGKATLLTLLSGVEDAIFFAMVIPVSLLLLPAQEFVGWQKLSHMLQQYGAPILLGLVLFGGLSVFVRKIRRRRKGVSASASSWAVFAQDFKAAVWLIYTQGRWPFFLSLLALTAQWLTRFSILVAMLLAFGLSDQLLHFFLLQWMIFVAMVLTPTPGGAGGTEAAFILVFGKIIPQTAIGTVLAGWRFMTYYFMLLTGVAILWLMRDPVADTAAPEQDLFL